MLYNSHDMKVAMPIWEGRLSPVMDSACRLLVAEINGGREISRLVYNIPPVDISGRARFIAGLGIDVLICGAISQQLEQMLTASGIRTNPWFRGEVDDIIKAHTDGNLQNDNFFLPGCRHRGRGPGRGRRQGGRGGYGRRRMNQEE